MTFRLVTYFAVAAVIAGIVFAANAQQGKWASESDPTANALIDMERRWAEESCTHSGIMETMLADDFQGTSPSGKRYTKTEAVASEKKPKAESRECRLNDAKVRFFSENMAIIYGSESSIKKNSDGKECTLNLIWTDTWLKRQGKWQVVAAQDTATSCMEFFGKQ